MIVYFSNVSGYTERFVSKLDLPLTKIPLYTKEETPVMEQPFILLFPSYGTGSFKRAVPKQVIKFLNVEQNRNHLIGIVGTGNKNFGQDYLLGARLASYKTEKPLLFGFELSGTVDDVNEVRKIYAANV